VPVLILDDVIVNAAAQETDLGTNLTANLSSTIPTELFIEALYNRITEPDCFGGLVIDRLNTRFLPFSEIASAIRAAFDKAKKKVAIVLLNATDDILRDRFDRMEQGM